MDPAQVATSQLRRAHLPVHAGDGRCQGRDRSRFGLCDADLLRRVNAVKMSLNTLMCLSSNVVRTLPNPDAFVFAQKIQNCDLANHLVSARSQVIFHRHGYFTTGSQLLTEYEAGNRELLK